MAENNYWQRVQGSQLTRRRILGATGTLLTGAGALATVGCGGGDDSGGGGTQPTVNQQPTPTSVPQAQAIRGGTMHWNGGATLDIWDPHWNASSYTLSPMLALVFNKLLKWDSPISSGKILGDLAEKWEQPTPTSVVLTLRKGVKFHNKPPMNGREFVASDVKWNIERQRDSTDPKFQRRYQYQPVTKVDTPDNYTVRLELKEPLAPFISYLAGQWAFMIGRETVDPTSDANREDAMVGTGPFMHQEFKPDVHHLQVRNPDYFLKGQPYLDASESVPLADAAAYEAAFRTKKIDYTYLGGLPYPTVQQIMKDLPDVQYQKVANLYFDYFRMATDRPPFNDVRVRQAVSASLNRKKAVEFVLFGSGTLNGAGVPSSLQPWGLKEDQLTKFPGYPNTTDAQVADARKLMEAAGYSDSKRLKVQLPAISPGPIVSGAEVEKEDLAKIYIDVEILPDTFPSLLKKQTQREMNIWRAQDNGYEDPDEYVYGSFFSTASRNFFGYKNPDMDALLVKQRQTLDAAGRKAVIDDIQNKLMQELPQIGLHSPAANYLRWPYLKNRKNSEWLNMYQIEEVWIDPNDPSAKGRPS